MLMTAHDSKNEDNTQSTSLATDFRRYPVEMVVLAACVPCNPRNLVHVQVQTHGACSN